MNAIVLLAEDDPVSRVFLVEALVSFGLRCDAAGDGLEALQRARTTRYDALLLDLNLPGCDGTQILTALRGDAAALSHNTPALALTADDSAHTAQRLQAAGFAAVAHKPIRFDRLATVLCGMGLSATRNVSPDAPASHVAPSLPAPWDDTQALSAAGGNRDIVAALREMMRAELPAQRVAIAVALQRGDAAAARAELHRLRASCGFCGAAALALSTDALHLALADGNGVAAVSAQFFADLDRLVSFA